MAAEYGGSLTEFWIVRHGETIENNTRTIAGQNSSGLTPVGRKQAELLANRLAGIPFNAVYLSDLNRTKQTADPIIKQLSKGVPAFTDSRLREKSAGRCEGHKVGYVEQLARMSGQSNRYFRPPAGESWEDVAARSRSFMRDMLEKFCNGQAGDARAQGAGVPHPESVPVGQRMRRVLMITHGGFMSEFLSSAVGGVTNSARNCSIYVLLVRRHGPRQQPHFCLKVANETEHVSSPLLRHYVELMQYFLFI